MTVSNNQLANEDTFNNAFISRTGGAGQSTSTTAKVAFQNAESVSGSSITNGQREWNSHASFVGMSINQVYNYLPTWAQNFIGSVNDSLFARVTAIIARFHGTSGHAHTGADGDGALIPYTSLSQVRAGEVSLAADEDEAEITFSSDIGAVTYHPSISILNVTDQQPIQLQWHIKAKTSAGFTIKFNQATDTANYVVEYSATRYS